jgi:hypothetical protein
MHRDTLLIPVQRLDVVLKDNVSNVGKYKCFMLRLFLTEFQQ